MRCKLFTAAITALDFFHGNIECKVISMPHNRPWHACSVCERKQSAAGRGEEGKIAVL